MFLPTLLKKLNPTKILQKLHIIRCRNFSFLMVHSKKVSNFVTVRHAHVWKIPEFTRFSVIFILCSLSSDSSFSFTSSQERGLPLATGSTGVIADFHSHIFQHIISYCLYNNNIAGNSPFVKTFLNFCVKSFSSVKRKRRGWRAEMFNLRLSTNTHESSVEACLVEEDIRG